MAGLITLDRSLEALPPAAEEAPPSPAGPFWFVDACKDPALRWGRNGPGRGHGHQTRRPLSLGGAGSSSEEHSLF